MTIPNIPRRLAPKNSTIVIRVDDGVRLLVQDDLEAIASYMREAAPTSPMTIYAGEEAEPEELAHLRYLAPHELKHVRLSQHNDLRFLSVSIGSAGAVTIRYDDRDPAARDAAERIEKYVQRLDKKSKWWLSWQWWITGLGPFFFAAVILNVVMYFVRPTFARWAVVAGVLRTSLD